MKGRYQKLIIWLVFEFILLFSGYDDMADYSEFIFDNKFIVNCTTLCSSINQILNINSLANKTHKYPDLMQRIVTV